MKLSDLNKKQKIELIEKIQSGSVAIINGEIVDIGVVLIKKDDKYYLNEYTPESRPVEPKDFEKLPGCTLIILPDNGR